MEVIDILFSFICLCYNQEKSIIELINSINSSRIPYDKYEIIIVDDGSIDNSIQNINTLSNETRKLNISVVEMKNNTKNQSLCRNHGIRKAQGKYIMFMDGDDVYISRNLSKLYRHIIEKDESKDVIFLRSLHKNLNGCIYLTGYSTDTRKEISHSITRYCVSKEFLLNSSIFFDEVKYNYNSEDCYFFYLMLNEVTEYSVFDEPVSYIRQRKNNNTYCKFKSKTYMTYLYELCNDLIKICDTKLHLFIRNYYIEEMKRYQAFCKDEDIFNTF